MPPRMLPRSIHSSHLALRTLPDPAVASLCLPRMHSSALPAAAIILSIATLVYIDNDRLNINDKPQERLALVQIGSSGVKVPLCIRT